MNTRFRVFHALKNAVVKTLTFTHFSSKSDTVMRILNVAEKNDAAKNIASLLSNGTSQKREGLSVYNKIYEFDYFIFNQNCKMIMTSVSGHLLNYDFPSMYRGWNSCDPLILFEAPVSKQCPKDYEKIKKTLEREIRSCSTLIIWTDCDREGENIGYEIINVCKEVKQNIRVYRAKFSEITRQSVQRAVNGLENPDKNVSDAVDVRQELDLRIGAAFTRFQTLHLKRLFPQALGDHLISYGSCQFPTLGFVVERFKSIAAFIPEPFWKIKVTDTRDELTVEFSWKRVRLFDELACLVLFDTCTEDPTATVEKVESKPKSKWRPKPLDTVELEKLASRKLRISAKETMKIAEKLYTQGFISYPRTETNIFPKDINLNSLVQLQVGDANWGDFAQRVLNDGPNPFQGNKSDQAHPPIHPIKYASQLSGQEKRIYEFIVRHFLACLSKHAEGLETVVDIDIAGEKFTAKGLMIIAKNYLDVYPYDKWNAKEIHIYREGERFTPKIEMANGETAPPELLTEADLIALMEKHGIGTDATHAEHIETIKARLYVGLKDDKYFVPKTLGMSLVDGYDNMGFEMSKPRLRAGLEADLKKICDGEKTPAIVLTEQIRKYRETFEEARRQVDKLNEAVQNYLQVQPTAGSTADTPGSAVQRVCPCPRCTGFLALRPKRDGGKFIGCESHPGCREVIWLPSFVLDVSVSDNTCNQCGPSTHMLAFRFSPGSCYLPPHYEGCIRGCDANLMSALTGPPDQNTQPSLPRPTQPSLPRPTQPSLPRATPPASMDDPRQSGDSGYGSGNRRPNRPSDDASNICCNCGNPAILLTVRKPGPNQGRQFYKCNVPQGSRGCNFFQWADDDGGGGGGGGGGGPPPQPRPPPPPRPPSSQRPPPPSSYGNPGASSSSNPCCYCGSEAKRLTVHKEGVNKGKSFFSCPKPMGTPNRCDFFEWAEGPAPSVDQGNSGFGFSIGRGGGSRGRGGRGAGGANRRSYNNDGGQGARRRKCGICGQEGHNRKNCDQR